MDVSKALTVSELSTRIRGILEPAFTQVLIKGEISNFRPASSGHVYFSLKDESSVVSAAIFGWGARMKTSATRIVIKDGLLVLCSGKISLYPPRGSYQLIIDKIEELGAGSLQVAFEKLKNKLQAEGLFAAERKKTIPRFPSRVAVITSPSGAAIRDILSVLARRAPQIEVLVVPALVQGEEAPRQIIQALKTVQKFQLAEVVILARGGGSIEDLWAFNDETLAREIAITQLPVISAVGHEIDFTISDFVADLRAPTPSAAAEILSGHWLDVRERLIDQKRRLFQMIRIGCENRKMKLSAIGAKLISPRERLRERAQRFDELELRMTRALHVFLEQKKSGIERWFSKLEALSPLKVLNRGYAIVSEPQEGGKIFRSIRELRSDQEILIRLQDGTRNAKVRQN